MKYSRVVVTHDLAFGHSAIPAGVPFVGIVYLRPGHILSAFVLEIVDTVIRSTIDVEPPFVLVADRRETAVRVRVRSGPPW